MWMHVRRASVQSTFRQIHGCDTKDSNTKVQAVLNTLLDKIHNIPNEVRQRDYEDLYGPIFATSDLTTYTDVIKQESPYSSDSSIDGLLSHVQWLSITIPASLKSVIVSRCGDRCDDVGVELIRLVMFFTQLLQGTQEAIEEQVAIRRMMGLS